MSAAALIVRRCWCGAQILNGHHCTNGHMQNRVADSMAAERCSCSICSAKVAYTALVKYHATEVLETASFRRTGRLTPAQVHAISRDLGKLDTDHPLDPTIERVLEQADAIELEREHRELQRDCGDAGVPL
jgi:hypothetical protein